LVIEKAGALSSKEVVKMAGSLVGRILNLMGFEETIVEEVVEDERFDGNSPRSLKSSFGRPKVVSLPSVPGAGGKVVVMQPSSFDEAREVSDHLKSRRTVVVNLEEVDAQAAQRIVDFVGGAVYALDGTVERVGSDIFLFAPSNVGVMALQQIQPRSDDAWSWLG
jgi:cell division inhibitor SepF